MSGTAAASSAPAALITGASSGIGEAFARALSRKGYRLILASRRRERLEKLAEQLPPADVLTADLAEDAGLRDVEARVMDEPRLEFLINNAGFGITGSFPDTDREALARMHRLHITAVMRLTHASLAGMAVRGKGTIINVSSVAGFLAAPGSVGYCSTKAWINRFTEGVHLELKASRSPVRIQALCPGFTHSEFHDIAGMDRESIPRFFWMTAEKVVDVSLESLNRNSLFVVPGRRYRFFLALHHFLPRRLGHAIAINYSRRIHRSST
ncbi:MAG TPA: SDR family oxidoreductase [Acidobacteriota bacterium]|nr:SDR family oxidoreductase [Acidobacteriota bacterium]